MGMLTQVANGASNVVQPPPPPAAQPQSARKLVLIDETIKPAGVVAQNAVHGAIYEVGGKPAAFNCNTDIGGTRYSSFTPLNGGLPLLVAVTDLVTPIQIPNSGAVPASPPAVTVQAQPPAAPVLAPPSASDPAAGGVVKRTRRTKAEMEAAKSSTEPAAKSSTPAPESAPVPAPSAGGIYLYFGCSPVGVVCASLAPYVAELDRQLREAGNLEVPDIRAAEGGQFGFGKWKAYIASLALESPPPAGHYLVTQGDERIQCAAEALAGVAGPGHVVIGGGR